MLATVYSRAQLGIEAPEVMVETHISNGLPALSIVGLPETTVKESKERVRSALLNAGFDFPTRRLTINLAPADLPKEGGRFDLAIAIGILAASGQIASQRLAQFEFLGELALSGELRPIYGALPSALATHRAGRALVISRTSGEEAARVAGLRIWGGSHLSEICAFLNDAATLEPCQAPPPQTYEVLPELCDIRGQNAAKRALCVAAAGGHNLLLYGPPGTGKTLLASRLPSILPPLNQSEAFEVAMIQSLTSHSQRLPWGQRPFRAPHHSASAVALVGGGSNPRPGEISLAHQGVLFLDELPEFPRAVLEVLREPLESGEIRISRARGQTTFPARFQLLAAMNPCPCGYLGDAKRHCRCRPDQVARYRGKLSGPLLDRIDMHVEVAALPALELVQKAPLNHLTNAAARDQVVAARALQNIRQHKLNARLSPADHKEHCPLAETEQRLLVSASERLGLSARAMHRIIRLARTIADMDNCANIQSQHLKEAIGYRKLDRKPH